MNRNVNDAVSPWLPAEVMPEECAELLQPPNPGKGFLSEPEWTAVGAAVRLSEREVQVARILLEGGWRLSIAGELHISVEAARLCIEQVFRKFHVQERFGLALRIARIRQALSPRPGGEGPCRQDFAI